MFEKDMSRAPYRPNFTKILDDRWVATSALQKGIRRGDEGVALLAASFLLAKQPDRFWRRLVVISLEDIGIGDLTTVREVLVISGKKKWREENGGDWLVAAELVLRLCRAPKSRDACDALVIADLLPSLAPTRSELLDYSTNQLADELGQSENLIGRRVLAAWLLAGTKRFPAFNLPERLGSFDQLLGVYEMMGVAPNALATAQLGSTRTNEGHAVTLPLISLLAAQSKTVELQHNSIPATEMIGGWPTYAFDMHTRTGKRAISSFRNRCEKLNEFIQKWIPNANADEFMGTLIFRLEGENVNQRLVYDGSKALWELSQQAHLTYQGLDAIHVTEALTLIQNELPLLNQCRIQNANGYSR